MTYMDLPTEAICFPILTLDTFNKILKETKPSNDEDSIQKLEHYKKFGTELKEDNSVLKPKKDTGAIGGYSEIGGGLFFGAFLFLLIILYLLFG